MAAGIARLHHRHSVCKACWRHQPAAFAEHGHVSVQCADDRCFVFPVPECRPESVLCHYLRRRVRFGHRRCNGIYTSADYKPVKRIGEQSETGPATTILSGYAIGLKSVVVPVLIIAIAVYVSSEFAGLYGVALAAVGMLSTVGITIAVDAYGPLRTMQAVLRK